MVKGDFDISILCYYFHKSTKKLKENMTKYQQLLILGCKNVFVVVFSALLCNF